MGWIVGGLIEALVAFLCDLISKMMNALTGAFTSVFGADPAAFRGIFPITEKFSEAFKAIGLGIAIGLVILSCVRNMFSGLGFAGENPFFNLHDQLGDGFYLFRFKRSSRKRTERVPSILQCGFAKKC